MDITSLFSVGSADMARAEKSTAIAKESVQQQNNSNFGSLLDTAINNINTTNGYLSDAEDEEIKWSLGETQNTHDLTIALAKASTSLQYTVAIRDKVMEAYKELMQIQI